ncbi:DUF4389 domain-containing protein [Pseudomonas poae]|uniref:DUF4389 domain-containing protein n=1 Tax=Pseudomonas poae TaxID=200451 RepID=UPI001644FA21|nr:DUF4389 domain-containing protein [Pseudomonas poae]MBC3195861.1 DUF4389 domain-containing protein [Pseudomonas poae]
MNDPKAAPKYESIVLRILWMLVFALVWQVAQFLAQIGRFGSFHTEQKPWPFADWPTPRAPEGEAAHSVPPAPHPVRDEEPKL